MTMHWKFLVFAMPVALAGCAVPPPDGPTVLAVPGKAGDMQTFVAADRNCREQAAAQFGPNETARARDNAVGTAAVGTAVGAAAGALIGSASGNAGAGALIGGGAGLATGAAIGAGGANASLGRQQYLYDSVYAQCMTANGHSVMAGAAPVIVSPGYGPSPYPYGYPYPYAYSPYPLGGVAVFGFRGGYYHRGFGGYRGGWHGRR